MKLKSFFCLILFLVGGYFLATGYMALIASFLIPNMPAMAEWIKEFIISQEIEGFSKSFFIASWLVASLSLIYFAVYFSFALVAKFINAVFGGYWAQDIEQDLENIVKKIWEWFHAKKKN